MENYSTINSAIETLLKAREAKREAEKAEEQAKRIIKDYAKERDSFSTDEFFVSLKKEIRQIADTAKIKELFPDCWQDLYKDSVSTKITPTKIAK